MIRGLQCAVLLPVALFALAGCTFDVGGDLPPAPGESGSPSNGAPPALPAPECFEADDCAPTTCGEYTECTGFEGECTREGTHERDCEVPVCDRGRCTVRPETETAACERDTDGQSCGDKMCGGFSECVAPGDVCSTEGTWGRTCLQFECSEGSCTEVGDFIESEPCQRDTDGKLCWVGTDCQMNHCQTVYFHCDMGLCLANP